MSKENFKIPSLITIARCLDFLNFVSDSTMKRNISYNLQYLDFLNELYSNYEITKSIEKSYIKNQIVILGSILECFIFSLLDSMSGSLDFGDDWKERGVSKKYIDLNAKERVKTVVQDLVSGELKPRSDLSWMIDIAEKNGLFKKSYADVAHFVREHRNKVHLTTMEELEYRYFKLEKLKEAKGCVRQFIERLSGKLKEEIKTTFPFLYS
jgi:hypothetical protein